SLLGRAAAGARALAYHGPPRWAALGAARLHSRRDTPASSPSRPLGCPGRGPAAVQDYHHHPVRMIPTPFDHFDVLVWCPALPGTAQEKSILGASPPPNPHHKSSDKPDLV